MQRREKLFYNFLLFRCMYRVKINTTKDKEEAKENKRRNAKKATTTIEESESKKA